MFANLHAARGANSYYILFYRTGVVSDVRGNSRVYRVQVSYDTS